MFIIDQNNHLIAAERADLEQWGFSDTLEAVQAFRKGRVQFEKEVGILLLPNNDSLTYKVETLDSLMGPWYLCRLLQKQSDEEIPADTAIASTKVEEEPLEVLSASTEEKPQEEETVSSAISEEQSHEAEEELEALLQLLPDEEETSGETLEEEPVSQAQKQSASSVEDSGEEEVLPLLTEEEPAHLELSLSTETEEKKQESGGVEEAEDLLKLLPEEEPTSETKEEEESPLLLLSEEESLSTPSSETFPTEELSPSLQEEETSQPASQKEPSLSIEEENNNESFALLEEPAEEGPITLQEEESSQQPSQEESPLVIEEKEKTWLEIEASFQPDLQSNAANLDLSVEEYQGLVNEFAHDFQNMKSNLLGNERGALDETVSILKDAIALLQLNPLEQIVDLIPSASPVERSEIVDTLQRILGHLESEEPLQSASLGREASSQEAASTLPEETPSAIPEEPEEAEVVEETGLEEEKEEAAPTEAKEVSTEDFLQGVRPIPIEFSLQIAAKELNLPEDLVLEFINDFANQGHEYLPVLIEEYQKKDLDKLQKTAHMLKGAASNLRVEAMVENLYELQFDNDIERAPERIRKFAGQLMSLDNFLKQLNG